MGIIRMNFTRSTSQPTIVNYRALVFTPFKLHYTRVVVSHLHFVVASPRLKFSLGAKWQDEMKSVINPFDVSRVSRDRVEDNDVASETFVRSTQVNEDVKKYFSKFSCPIVAEEIRT